MATDARQSKNGDCFIYERKEVKPRDLQKSIGLDRKEL